MLQKMWDDLDSIISDPEFPEDLRDRAESIKKKDYWLAEKVDAMHRLFHMLKQRNIRTRFGKLTDDPQGILANKRKYERKHNSHQASGAKSHE